VEAHHGSISVSSEPGDTTFFVRLPAKPANPTAAKAAEPDAEAPEAGVPAAAPSSRP